MADNSKTIHQLYVALSRLNPAGMAECYAPDAVFEDEVFKLSGRHEIIAMWSMLCDSARLDGPDVWRLDYRDVFAKDNVGSLHWKVRYRFGPAARVVLNRIDSEFLFDDAGLIVAQQDRFKFWAWSRQALGLRGYLLGWTPYLKRRVRKLARQRLVRFLEHPPAK